TARLPPGVHVGRPLRRIEFLKLLGGIHVLDQRVPVLGGLAQLLGTRPSPRLHSDRPGTRRRGRGDTTTTSPSPDPGPRPATILALTLSLRPRHMIPAAHLARLDNLSSTRHIAIPSLGPSMQVALHPAGHSRSGPATAVIAAVRKG